MSIEETVYLDFGNIAEDGTIPTFTLGPVEKTRKEELQEELRDHSENLRGGDDRYVRKARKILAELLEENNEMFVNLMLTGLHHTLNPKKPMLHNSDLLKEFIREFM